MKNKSFGYALATLVVLGIAYLWFNPHGIKIGYKIAGGKESSNQDTVVDETEIIYHEYMNQIEIYDRYRNSDNPTAQKWAETAKQKANELADRYNELVGEVILNGV